jgi:hypothetical protein
MVNLSYARKVIEKHLEDMNRSPYDLKLESFEDNSGILNLTGRFQDGFLGDTYGFEATVDSRTWTITKFKLTGKIEE